QRLVEGYAGNPLALKIVAQAVFDLFGGDLDRFLQEGETGLQRCAADAAPAGGAPGAPGIPPAHLAGRAARVDGASRSATGPASQGAARAGLGGAGGAETALTAGAGAAGELQPAIGGDGVPQRCAGRTPGR